MMKKSTLAIFGIAISTHLLFSCQWNLDKWEQLGPLDPNVNFICGDSLVDVRDGKKYATQEIGSQCWIVQNLNVGEMLPDRRASDHTNKKIEKSCYANDESNCEEYGALYEWDEAMFGDTTLNSPDICPTGWHVPTNEEWKKLERTFGYNSMTIDSMGWRARNLGFLLRTEKGFNALLSGAITPSPGKISHNKDLSGSFWTADSTDSNPSNRSWIRQICDDPSSYCVDRSKANNYTLGKKYSISVRCLKNE